ncbi:hypothetical protein FS749_009327 [Ceratobasidium sp. UAMH 11750]|nr:hypothetical protein FS749_009327 [Ceratobasidium sp. UAMH 11750]
MIRDVPVHSDNIVMIITRASGRCNQLAGADPPFLANLYVTGGSVEYELARPDLGHRVTPAHSSRNMKVGLGLQCLIIISSSPCSEIILTIMRRLRFSEGLDRKHVRRRTSSALHPPVTLSSPLSIASNYRLVSILPPARLSPNSL